MPANNRFQIRNKLFATLSVSLILLCVLITLKGQTHSEAHATLEGTRSYLPMVNRYYPTWGSTGILDPSFGDDGIVISNFTDFNDEAQAVVLQEDGKIIAAGGIAGELSVARYNTDGSLDLSFSEDGVTSVGFGDDVYASAVALQLDGKIVVGGYGYGNFILARFHPNGSLDTSFGGDGKVATNFLENDGINALAIQLDGKIIALGYAFNNIDVSTSDFTLARYNPDGSLDLSFDGDGKLTTDFFGLFDYATDIVLQPDGKILVTGHVGDITKTNIGVVRYNSNGSLDVSFDGDGKAITGFVYGAAGEAIELQADGKIVVAGRASNSRSSDVATVRYNANGSLDTDFGDDGLAITVFLGGSSIGYDLDIQPDGKIVVVGTASFTNFETLMTDDDFALVRYNADGSPDLGFGDEGKVTTNINQVEYGIGTVLQSDGKIVVVGFTKSDTGYTDSVVLRYK